MRYMTDDTDQKITYAKTTRELDTVLRIQDVLSRSRIFSILDPGSASENLSILTEKIVSKLSEI
jgi:hypothetical protein